MSVVITHSTLSNRKRIITSFNQVGSGNNAYFEAEVYQKTKNKVTPINDYRSTMYTRSIDCTDSTVYLIIDNIEYILSKSHLLESNISNYKKETINDTTKISFKVNDNVVDIIYQIKDELIDINISVSKGRLGIIDLSKSTVEISLIYEKYYPPIDYKSLISSINRLILLKDISEDSLLDTSYTGIFSVGNKYPVIQNDVYTNINYKNNTLHLSRNNPVVKAGWQYFLNKIEDLTNISDTYISTLLRKKEVTLDKLTYKFTYLPEEDSLLISLIDSSDFNSSGDIMYYKLLCHRDLFTVIFSKELVNKLASV